jgi:hypothetical protein
MELNLHLTDAEAALAEVRKTIPGGTATLTTHDGTLHVFLDSVAAYGVFTAALAAKIIERAFVGPPACGYGNPAAIARAARTTWDDRLAEKGWMDGGVLGVWYEGVTVIEDPPPPATCRYCQLGITQAAPGHWAITGLDRDAERCNFGPGGRHTP